MLKCLCQTQGLPVNLYMLPATYLSAGYLTSTPNLYSQMSPPLPFTYLLFPQSSPSLNCPVSLSGCWGYKPWTHPWVLFFFYTLHVIPQQMQSQRTHVVPACYHSGLSCRSICSPLLTGHLFQPYSLSTTAKGSYVRRIMSDLPGWSNIYVPLDGAGDNVKWKCGAPLQKQKKTAIKGSKY